MALKTSRSFIFSRELLNVIRKQRSQRNTDIEYMRYLTLLESLVYFGNYEFFVIHTANTGMISMNALPLAFKYEDENSSAVGQMMLPLESPVVIPKETVEIVDKVICDMNAVLVQIVPGLTISVKELGTQLLENGKTGSRIYVFKK